MITDSRSLDTIGQDLDENRSEIVMALQTLKEVSTNVPDIQLARAIGPQPTHQ